MAAATITRGNVLIRNVIPKHLEPITCLLYTSYAAQSGVVTYAGQTRGGYGIHVILNHGGGVQTLYGHCSGLAVSVGQVVEQGQLIAYVGSTGWSTGPHCHFEVIVNGVRRDPMNYLG